jgi:secreted PhoX family phosphatase
VSQHLSLAGTLRNCAGGPTPWGSWISCEETTLRAGEGTARDHGYAFEVPATAGGRPAPPVPLTAMGRFNHEAVAVDPATGIVYETEDLSDGLLYRFLPARPGRLSEGGRLQALSVAGRPGFDTRNWEEPAVTPGTSLDVAWIDLDDVASPADDLRYRGFAAGAALFARGEGMWYGRGALYFACTNGGRTREGQIWRYRPGPQEGAASERRAPGRLELFVEPNERTVVQNADNLTVAPWGDLVVCEDGPEEQFLVGVTPEGVLYKIAHNALSASELAGVTFSPDGSTLFVNLQGDGLTLAVTGPWNRAG